MILVVLLTKFVDVIVSRETFSASQKSIKKAAHKILNYENLGLPLAD